MKLLYEKIKQTLLEMKETKPKWVLYGVPAVIFFLIVMIVVLSIAFGRTSTEKKGNTLTNRDTKNQETEKDLPEPVEKIDFMNQTSNGIQLQGTAKLVYDQDRGPALNLTGGAFRSGYAKLPDNLITKSKDDLTITMWLKVNALAEYNQYIYSFDNADNYSVLYAFVGKDGTLTVNNNMLGELITQTPLSIGKWIHLTISYTNNKMSIYVNGTSFASFDGSSGKATGCTWKNLNGKENETTYFSSIDKSTIKQGYLGTSSKAINWDNVGDANMTFADFTVYTDEISADDVKNLYKNEITAVKYSVTLQDNASGIKIEATNKDVVNSADQLIVKTLTEGTEFDKVKSALGVQYTKFSAYDLSLQAKGTKVEPDGILKVTMKVPSDIDPTKASVYYVNTAGEKILCASIVKDSNIIFETNHFSIYVITQEDPVVQEETTTAAPVQETQAQTEAVTEATETETENTEQDTVQNTTGTAPVSSLIGQSKTVSFSNVSVHDPSIVKVGDWYYIFGSHLAAAKSQDLINWQLVASGADANNKLFKDGTANVTTELAETFSYAQTSTLWAPDVIQLSDGRYYMYYCACKGDQALSALGVAVSNNIEGPYKNNKIILKSVAAGSESNPNVVDPSVFYDKNRRLWMMYGSYSGGIFILELNPSTGLPMTSGYGKKILGGNHCRIEGSYVMYSPETGYYYMFLSFGGLNSTDGYNIRVCRSTNPDGPYYDAKGNNMLNCVGDSGKYLEGQDAKISNYGLKLMGNYKFTSGTSYYSPGHNSAYYDASTGKYYLIFHTRFALGNENFQDRVHQMFMNEDGWPVVAPYRYTGETITTAYADDVAGTYELVNHGTAITNALAAVQKITLTKTDASSGTISGAYTGTWTLSGDHNITITMGNTIYKGVCLIEWNEGTKKYTMTLSAQSGNTSIMAVRQ